MIKKLPIVFLMLFSIVSIAQTISGKVYDEYLEPFPGANVKTSTQRISTDIDGNFTLTKQEKFPFTLEVSAVGYKTEIIEVTDANQELNVILKESLSLDEVVISASRAPERIIESPVTIERLGLNDVKNGTSISFYEDLANLKEVDVNENSIGFKSVNTRGFSPFENTRFVQLIDGVDNSVPIFNFSVGNLAGISELDVESVEILPGAASALYGANAFNGILLARSKNPFEYGGISTYVKTGITRQEAAGSNNFYDVGIRMAHAFSNKFAAKVNFTYFEGEDWHADNESNTTGIGGVETGGFRRVGDLGSDPNYDGVNIYGDEVSGNINGIARDLVRLGILPVGTDAVIPSVNVSRTGYREKDLVDYRANGLKFDASLHFRPFGNEDLEIVWNSRYNRGDNNIYQGTNRYTLKDFLLQQHKLEFIGKNFFVRGYYSENDAGNSFDTRFAAINLNESWKSNNRWFAEYIGAYARAFTGNIPNVPANNAQAAHLAGRTAADTGRLVPGTAQYQAALNTVSSDVAGGVKLLDRSAFYHADANYNFRDVIEWAEIQVGGSYRLFNLNSQGSIYTDANSRISFDEFGLYSQIQKKFLDDRLKFTGSVRYDKSQNFDGNFSPRVSLSYGLGENKDHILRGSFQTGFRNPTTQDQYIGFFAGATHILGTAQDNLSRYSVNVTNNDGTTAILTGQDAIDRSFSALSVSQGNPQRANYNLVKPEKVKSFEAGYRGVFNLTDTNLLEIDLNGYYNDYEDFLTEKVAFVAHYGEFVNGAPDAALLNAWNNRDLTRFSIKTNSTAEVSSYGAGLGLKTKFFKKFDFGLAYNWARFRFDRSTDEEFKPGFNTPEHKVKVQFGNANLFKNFGFNINARWQNSFVWESRFLDGVVDARTILDAQVNYRVPSIKSRFKLGGTNLTGKEYIVAPGSGLIGSMYYISWTIND
ncbi:membrane protein [Tenacibaculum holothuriorum]|uniref:Membrane protein n=1 Tax=Tenacibaculum holothuriorum TaxID=1635173 RepID=A0A1Y2PFW4_9FLAO|nr:TonB-dependent receptor [Tenacibaculum holothuriorum]OSY88901.1 membrane protein [Tenacibaculum holothuriorum]